jgi:DNA-damage-inducible protein D
MSEENSNTAITPFERIRRTNPTGSEFWSSRDFAQVLGYTDYRNFEAVIEKARTAFLTAASASRIISLKSPK